MITIATLRRGNNKNKYSNIDNIKKNRNTNNNANINDNIRFFNDKNIDNSVIMKERISNNNNHNNNGNKVDL